MNNKEYYLRIALVPSDAHSGLHRVELDTNCEDAYEVATMLVAAMDADTTFKAGLAIAEHSFDHPERPRGQWHKEP